MRQLLIDTLTPLGYPIYLQGSAPPEVPDTFFTFWNDDTDSTAFYDDKPRNEVSEFTVYVYAKDPQLVMDTPKAANALLEDAGFVIARRGYDVMSGIENYTGRALECFYDERSDNG
jgi:hypothetical protein